MNLYLHEIQVDIFFGDSLAEGPQTMKRYDCVLTNPPFGNKGAGEAPNREDFTVETSNKQLNFIQHVMHILKPGGRAAMVVPDNVLFEGGAGRNIRQILMEDCDLHTILRLPIGTFSPYSPGVKANIIFFRKGLKTKDVWIFDLRTNVEKINKGHTLTSSYFSEFEKAYGIDANGHPCEGRHETDRFKRFSRDEIKTQDENLDIFWLRDDSQESGDNLPDPETLVSEIRTHLQTAQDALEELSLLLEDGRKASDDA
jgi:type I restriction enzyme M protein